MIYSLQVKNRTCLLPIMPNIPTHMKHDLEAYKAKPIQTRWRQVQKFEKNELQSHHPHDSSPLPCRQIPSPHRRRRPSRHLLQKKKPNLPALKPSSSSFSPHVISPVDDFYGRPKRSASAGVLPPFVLAGGYSINVGRLPQACGCQSPERCGSTPRPIWITPEQHVH